MKISIEEMATFCKQKGFVYPSSEIYNGIAGFWDFGPLGVELKNNIQNNWWKFFVQNRQNVVGMDSSIISNPMVWRASGHTENFADLIITCDKCKEKQRADQFIEDKLGITIQPLAKEVNKIIQKEKLTCPKCKGNFQEVKDFNLMFETQIGPTGGYISYLRPETAQSIFTNFKIVTETSRQKLPFGIAQIGKAFRNEISPRDFLFRCREFNQMEMEFFTIDPNDCNLFDKIKNQKVKFLSEKEQLKDEKIKLDKIITFNDIAKLTTKWHAYWLHESYIWFINLGVKEENLRIRQHITTELSHYAKATFDIEYYFPFGWKEIHGNADRQKFDLTQHEKFSKQDQKYFDELTKKKEIPYVAAEPSQGVERAFLSFLFDAYNNDTERGNIVLKLHPILAPIKVAIFPLVNKLNERTQEIYNEIKNDLHTFFDSKGSIGRRYARADEQGTPYCLTYDFDSIEKNDITIRDRDTTKQIRIPIKDLKYTLIKLINGEIKFEDLGEFVA